jgi:hypothetical protein
MDNRQKKTRKIDIAEIERRMCAILDSVDYDLSAFTMDGFREYLEACTGRPIEFADLPLQSKVSGAWVPAADGCDYIIADVDVPVCHKTHIQLHELSHILCCHPPADSAELLSGASGTTPVLLLRSGHSEKVDLEAEIMACMIQERVLRYGRLQELLTEVSSNRDVADYIRVVRLT